MTAITPGEAKILAELIRREFDTSHVWMVDYSKELIGIALKLGLDDLAGEMACDLMAEAIYNQ